MLTQKSSANWGKREICNLIEHTLWMAPYTIPFNEQNFRHLQVQSPDFNCRIYYMITIDTSPLVHFFASKNQINLYRIHVSCYIYVVTLKCILSRWNCTFIKPLNVSNALYPYPLSLEVITEHIFTP